jgi:hypothetical protein
MTGTPLMLAVHQGTGKPGLTLVVALCYAAAFFVHLGLSRARARARGLDLGLGRD